jgi:hypothetical protein
MFVGNEYSQFLGRNVFFVLRGKHAYNIEGGCDDGMCNVSELGISGGGEEVQSFRMVDG